MSCSTCGRSTLRTTAGWSWQFGPPSPADDRRRRDRGPHRPRQDGAAPRAHGDRRRPPPGGAASRHDDRRRLCAPRVAGRRITRLRGRPGPRPADRQHAGRGGRDRRRAASSSRSTTGRGRRPSSTWSCSTRSPSATGWLRSPRWTCRTWTQRWRAAVRDEVGALLARTTLAAATDRRGLVGQRRRAGALRAELLALRDRVMSRPGYGAGPTRMSIDRAFGVRGRGVVVTGSLRGGSVVRGATLRLDPGRATFASARCRSTAGGRARHGRWPRRPQPGRCGARRGVPGPDRVRRPGDRNHRSVAGPAAAGRWPRRRCGPDGRRLRQGLPVRVHIGTDEVDGALEPESAGHASGWTTGG